MKTIQSFGQSFSLKARFVLFFVVFVGAISIVAVVTLQRQIRDITDLIGTHLGLPVALRAAAFFNGDRFEAFLGVMDEDDPFYREISQKFYDLKQETNCQYLYAMTPYRGNIHRFIIDGSGLPGERGFSPLGSEEDITDYDDAYMKTYRTGEPQVGFITQQESWGTVISSYVPVINSRGIVVGIVGCDYDAETIHRNLQRRNEQQLALSLLFIITGLAVFISLINAITAQNERLRDLNVTAKAASEAKNNFLARTSHEIRTPMNAIMGMTELLLRINIPAAAREYALNIKQAGANLLSIINDILDFSKIESGKLDIVPVGYELASVINDCLSIIRTRLGEKLLRLLVEVDPGLPSGLSGDLIRIRQVLLNLLSNAIKYTNEGSVHLRVSSASSDGKKITLSFSITDTGIGIKQKDMEKLFGDFQRVDMAHNQGIEGTGLGLAISRNLCRLMGGDITVQSTYGKGSTFTAFIPQIITTGDPIGTLWEGEAQFPLPKQIEIRFIAPEAKLLVVDDIRTNLDVAGGLLEPYQAKIDTATNGADAIELVKQNHYDIIFMDHMMPGMDGIEAVRRIRDLEREQLAAGTRKSAIPIIALTANAMSGMKEMFLQNGFDDYLSKPIDIAKLDDCLDRWIPGEKRNIPKTPFVRGSGDTVDAGLLKISGLDIKKGIAMTGGTAAAYRNVLFSYVRDAGERLVLFETATNAPGTADLKAFTIHIHALKSASATIGAVAIAEEAALLEEAGKNGDLALITVRLPGFCGMLAELLQGIRAEFEQETARTDARGGEAISREQAALLKDALLRQDIRTIDKLLAEYENLALDTKSREKVSAISDAVLMTEFDKALTLVDDIT